MQLYSDAETMLILYYEEDAEAWARWFRKRIEELLDRPDVQRIAMRNGGENAIRNDVRKMLEPASRVREFLVACMLERLLAAGDSSGEQARPRG
jgi:hypothetical protein